MLLSNEMAKSLNKQINFEYESAYIYKAMAQFFAQKGLNGFRTFFSKQAEEEVEHAQKLIDYVNERGNEVELTPFGQDAKLKFSSLREIIEDALHHEQEVTRRINDLMTLAREEKDYATEQLLGWFVSEQVEEEDTFNSIIDTLDFVKEDPIAIYMLDGKLGQRQ